MSIASKLERCRAHEATEGWKREGERQEEEEPRADLARNGERGCVRLATKLSRGAPPFSPLAGGEAKRRATGHPDDADTEAPRGSREPASPPRRIAEGKIHYTRESDSKTTPPPEARYNIPWSSTPSGG